MKKINNFYIALIAIIAIILIFGGYVFRIDIRNLLIYGSNSWPTHEASDGCFWEKKTFSQITFFEQNCSDTSLNQPMFENKDGSIVQTKPTKYGYSFLLQIFAKKTGESPLDIVKEWYERLTPDQQQVCDIQNADEPIEHFYNGEVHWTENPHPTPHKTRYKIDIKPDISKKIMQKSEPGDTKYNYMCGYMVGTTFAGHAPYFEFDDSSPDKYLLVGAYGQEGPMIDLNSLQF